MQCSKVGHCRRQTVPAMPAASKADMSKSGALTALVLFQVGRHAGNNQTVPNTNGHIVTTRDAVHYPIGNTGSFGLTTSCHMV